LLQESLETVASSQQYGEILPNPVAFWRFFKRKTGNLDKIFHFDNYFIRHPAIFRRKKNHCYEPQETKPLSQGFPYDFVALNSLEAQQKLPTPSPVPISILVHGR
jgi:hypothetical protein